MFKILGILLLIYIARCLATGDVFAKAGPWGRTYHRDEHGWEYWGAIGSYAALAIALLFVF